MKKIFLTDPPEILEELSTIVDGALPLSIYVNGAPTKVASLKEISERPEGRFLVVHKPADWQSGLQILFMLYKRPGLPFRGFQFQLAVETDRLLVAKVPTELFEIQRRRFERLPVPESSQATFFLGKNNRVGVSGVEDISLGGAKLINVVADELRKGDVIGPITFSLVMKYSTLAHEISVPEAKVVRVLANSADATKANVGISFELTSNEQRQFSTFLDLLQMTLRH